jgi:hypothetical protein
VALSEMVNLLPEAWNRDNFSSMKSAWDSFLEVEMEIGAEKEIIPAHKLDKSESLFHIRQLNLQDC